MPGKVIYPEDDSSILLRNVGVHYQITRHVAGGPKSRNSPPFQKRTMTASFTHSKESTIFLVYIFKRLKTCIKRRAVHSLV